MLTATPPDFSYKALIKGIAAASRVAFFLLFLGVVCPANLAAITIDWGGSFNDRMVDSDGDLLTSGFSYQLGAFKNGFTPTADNGDQWFLNWYTFDQASFTNQAIDDFGTVTSIDGYFTGSADLGTNGRSNSAYATPAAVFSGLPAYLWIYDSKQPVGSVEWFLARDPEWIFPDEVSDCCGGGLPLNWAVSDFEDAVPIFGLQQGIAGGGSYTAADWAMIQTSTVEFIDVPSLPEPSAAWFAAGIASLIGFGRRRLAR